ncbi:ribonuclease H-like domain-containing protein, partial [Tanacetum coccineum]
MVGASSSNDKINNLDLDETCLKSTYANSDPMSNQWERCNSIVLSWLLNYVFEDLFLGQIFSDNASEVWAELKETYNKLDGSIIFNLLQKIHNFKQGELNVSEYYHKLNSLWREFDIMTKLPKCSCDASKDVSKHYQLIKLMQFLMGLNDVFQPIRSSLLAMETLPDVKDAFTIISKEESHRGIASSSGSLGHTVDRCFDNLGYPPGYNKNPGPKPNGPRTFNANSVSSSSEKGVSLSFTNEQMMKLLNLINEAPSGSVQANMA